MNYNSSLSLPLKILVIDDHPLVLGGTLDVIRQNHPEAEIATARTAQETLNLYKSFRPHLVVIDLSIPETKDTTGHIETGIYLLQQLMKSNPQLNLMVYSSYIKALVRIKYEIDAHLGGFTITDKGQSTQEFIKRLNWALEGIAHTKDLNTALEVKPEWVEVLKLAFDEGLQDKAIAQRMNVAERTVRHYWTKIQDTLGIYPEDTKREGKNIRIETEIRARAVGLID